MSTLAYPSPDFPGPPSVTLEVGDDWEPVHAPGTMLAARLPRPEGFSPNVVVTLEPCAPDDAVERSLEQVVTIAGSRGGGVSEPYAAELGGARFVGCDATWPDSRGRATVLHANLFHVAGAGDTAYLVQLTGAVGGPAAEADYDLVRSVLTTVRVQPWTRGRSDDARSTTHEHDPAHHRDGPRERRRSRAPAQRGHRRRRGHRLRRRRRHGRARCR